MKSHVLTNQMKATDQDLFSFFVCLFVCCFFFFGGGGGPVDAICE